MWRAEVSKAGANLCLLKKTSKESIGGGKNKTRTNTQPLWSSLIQQLEIMRMCIDVMYCQKKRLVEMGLEF